MFGFYFLYLMVVFLVVFVILGIILFEIENYNVYIIIVCLILWWKYVLVRYLGVLIFINLYLIVIFFSIYIINKILGFFIEYLIL